MTVYQFISLWVMSGIFMYFRFLNGQGKFEAKDLVVAILGGLILLFIFIVDTIICYQRR